MNRAQETGVNDSIFAELRRLSPKVTGGLLRMRQEAYRDAAVSAKYKLLAAMAISIAIRCEPCIKYYAQKAREAGATDTELSEMLAVAPAMGACVAEMWALKAFAAAKQANEGELPDETCCA